MRKILRIAVQGIAAVEGMKLRFDDQEVILNHDGMVFFEAEPGPHIIQYFAVGAPGSQFRCSVEGAGISKWDKLVQLPAKGMVAGFKTVVLPPVPDPDDWPGPRAAPR